MDVLYGTDHKLGDMEDSDMTDFLDSDMFNTHSMVSYDEIGHGFMRHFHMFSTNVVLGGKYGTETLQNRPDGWYSCTLRVLVYVSSFVLFETRNCVENMGHVIARRQASASWGTPMCLQSGLHA